MFHLTGFGGETQPRSAHQLTLFDAPPTANRPTHPPHNKTDTSRGAAASITFDKVETDRAKVLAYVAKQRDHGATADEIGHALGLLAQSCTPRIWELRKCGEIIDSGHRRPTQTGRAARVYVVTNSR